MNPFESFENVAHTITKLWFRGKRRIDADFDSPFAVDVLPYQFEDKKEVENRLGGFFQDVDTFIKESLFLYVYAEFERVVFHKAHAALGEAQKVIDNQYPNQAPFHGSRASMTIKVSSMNGLGDLRAALMSHLSATDRRYLKQMTKYRDYLVHGKRFYSTEAAEFEKDIDFGSIVSFMNSTLAKL